MTEPAKPPSWRDESWDGRDMVDEYLPSICIDVWMSLNASSDPLTDKQLLNVKKYILTKLMFWSPTLFEPRKNFDDAIHTMCMETLIVLEKEIAYRNFAGDVSVPTSKNWSGP